MIITRQQYLNADREKNPNYHREYYAQFVTDEVKNRVLARWTVEELKESLKKDKHFNTKITPLEAWDRLGGFVFKRKLLDEANEGYSSATAVCIYKEAARQIIESN